MIYTIKIEYHNITEFEEKDFPIFVCTHSGKKTIPEIIKKALKRTQGLWRNEPEIIKELCKEFNNTKKLDIIGYGIEPKETQQTKKIFTIDIEHQLINNISFNSFLTT